MTRTSLYSCRQDLEGNEILSKVFPDYYLCFVASRFLSLPAFAVPSVPVMTKIVTVSYTSFLTYLLFSCSEFRFLSCHGPPDPARGISWLVLVTEQAHFSGDRVDGGLSVELVGAVFCSDADEGRSHVSPDIVPGICPHSQTCTLSMVRTACGHAASSCPFNVPLVEESSRIIFLGF